MDEVVINNIKRTKFYGYCYNVGKRCMHWEIEFPKSELEKLEPFVRVGRKVKFDNKDGSTEEWDCPMITYVKNHKFIYNGGHCDIFSAIGFKTNEKGEEVCYTTAFFPIVYRRYRMGDTISITGCQGKLFNSDANLELKKCVELGVECVLVSGEDNHGNVKIPRGILDADHTYISAKCIELVKAVEDKPPVVNEPTVKHFVEGPDDHLYVINDSKLKSAIAWIWYNPKKVPVRVVKEFVENIKDTVTKKPIIKKNKIETHNSIMENKTSNDEFDRNFGAFERQFAEMRDAQPNEVRDFIATIILAAAHDNSLVSAALKYVENKNNTTKSI